MMIYAFESEDNSVNDDNRLHFIRTDPSDGSEVWHKGFDGDLSINLADRYTIFMTIEKETETYFYLAF